MAKGDRSGALQKKFKKSVSKARSRGIDSRPRYQNIDKRVKEQTKGIKGILQRSFWWWERKLYCSAKWY